MQLERVARSLQTSTTCPLPLSLTPRESQLSGATRRASPAPSLRLRRPSASARPSLRSGRTEGDSGIHHFLAVISYGKENGVLYCNAVARQSRKDWSAGGKGPAADYQKGLSLPRYRSEMPTFFGTRSQPSTPRPANTIRAWLHALPPLSKSRSAYATPDTPGQKSKLGLGTRARSLPGSKR